MFYILLVYKTFLNSKLFRTLRIRDKEIKENDTMENVFVLLYQQVSQIILSDKFDIEKK